MIELDLDDLHVYDSGGDDLPVFWHHGTPQTGKILEPLEHPGIRWLSYDRPGYGGSKPSPGRTVADVAKDVAKVADALDINRFAVMGHSGGGTFALGCAAVLPERVSAVVSIAGIAPFGTPDWFTGMGAGGAQELKAAIEGHAQLEKCLTENDFDPEMFTPEDHAALKNDWSGLGTGAGEALANGIGGMVDDDLAYVTEWGCDPTKISVPVLVLHGEQDRVIPFSHAEWFAQNLANPELWRYPEDGHISVLNHSRHAIDWLLA